jgi:glycine C-acetyltransferase
LPPPIVAAGIKAFELLAGADSLRRQLRDNSRHFRARMTEAGFDIKSGEHPIAPVMLYESAIAQQFATALLERGMYVIAFSYPVVPKGEARIRVQLSAAHSRAHLDRAIEAFTEVGRKLGVIR